MTATIHLGDCRAVLATLPAESVHCVFTSPPYFGARIYDGSDNEWEGGSADCDHAAMVAAASAKRSGERVALSGSRATQEGTKQAQYMTCPGCGANRVMEWAGGDSDCDHNAACAEYAERAAGGPSPKVNTLGIMSLAPQSYQKITPEIQGIQGAIRAKINLAAIRGAATPPPPRIIARPRPAQAPLCAPPSHQTSPKMRRYL